MITSLAIITNNNSRIFFDMSKMWFFWTATLNSQNLSLEWILIKYTYPANICLFKVNHKSTRKRFEICSKLTIATPERRQWHLSGIAIVNFEHFLHLFLVFLLLTLNMKMSAGYMFMISKDWRFYCENLQAITLRDKTLWF